MSSAETPAERIACDLALDIHQGHIGPGELLPSVDRLMTLYDVPEASAAAALTRLSRAGIITGGASRGAVVQLQIAGMVYPALDIMAAAAMCRELASIPGAGLGPFAAGVLRAGNEMFLSAALRAIRGALADSDARLVALAQDILRVGGSLPITQPGAPRRREMGAGSAVPGADGSQSRRRSFPSEPAIAE
jgi:DNA-binding transcriptional regulator YhcF (GntR family)